MSKGAAFLQIVPATGSTAAHYFTRLRFRKARPRCHLPPWLDEGGAAAFASVLRGTTRSGYAIEWHRGGWRALVELVDDTVLEVPLDEQEHDQALAHAATLARKARAQRIVTTTREAGPVGETFATYARRWTAARAARSVASADEAKRRLELHVLPLLGPDGVRLGDRAIGHVTRDHLEHLVEVLDAKAREGSYETRDGGRESFGWRMAVHVWSDVTNLFRDAKSAKSKAMRARPDNPCDEVHGPDRGGAKSKVYLWPSEFLSFVSCEAVPLRWRRLVALSVYLYVRPGELAALEWSDVDLRLGTVHVHRSIDRVRKTEATQTKTGSARKIPIEPGLLPLLRAMHREADGKGPIVALPSTGTMSSRLRELLERAGVKRPDLHHADATRKAMTFYDLRATGITWAAVRGDDHLRIMQRAGHEGFTTTLLYIREAENLGGTFGQVFPELPVELLGGVAVDRFVDRPNPTNSKTPESSEVSSWALQDLNL